MGFNIDGLDDLIDDLENLQNEVNKVSEMDGELFPRQFMHQYTNAEDINEFFGNSPWEMETKEDFESIPVTELDRYVDEHSRFRTWGQMKDKAGSELVKRRLNL